MHIPDILRMTWPYLVTVIHFCAMLATAVHILYRKQDTRAAAAWLGLVWFVPVLGICLYWLFGINRITRRARLRFADKRIVSLPETEAAVSPEFIEQSFSPVGKQGLLQLSRMTFR